MDVSMPIRAIIPTLDGPVLSVLAGVSAPLPLTEVAKGAGVGSLSGVRLALRRLVRQGVVLEPPGGYVLNRDHVAAPGIELLAGMRATFIRRVGELVDTWDPAPLLLGAFGSFARRDGGPDSDIDLLVITKAKDATEQAGDLAEHVRAWTGNQCHVVTLRPADIARLRRVDEPILADWRRDLEPIRGSVALLGSAR